MPKSVKRAPSHEREGRFPIVAGDSTVDRAFQQLSKTLFEIAKAGSEKQKASVDTSDTKEEEGSGDRS